jgi:4-hydroxy-tetrahydrodipicolinate reductase
VRLALLGYGRMGHEVERVAQARGHEVAVRLEIDDNERGAGITAEGFAGIDAAIDFSQPAAVLENVDRATQIGIPLVVGTTGWYEHIDDVRRMVEQRGAAVVYGANFSVGANLFFRLAEHAARLFDAFDEYDPYVLEHHHRDKIDAPSGTALRLGELVVNSSRRKTKLQTGNPAGAIDRDALHVASLRAGGAFGEHRVGFDGHADAVQLVHSARGREGFARGALLATEWIRDKVGFFEFGAVLEEITERARGPH